MRDDDAAVCDFAAVMAEIMARKRISAASVARVSDVGNARGALLLSGSKAPTRDEVLKIAVAISMTPIEVDTVLVAASHLPLDRADPRDTLIASRLERGRSLVLTSAELVEAGEEGLL